MNLKVLFFFIFSIIIKVKIFAQDEPMSYESICKYALSYIPDSNNRKNIPIEIFNLYINDSISLFESNSLSIEDSAILSEKRKGNKSGPPLTFFMTLPTNNFVFHIFKKKDTIVTFDKFHRKYPGPYQKYVETKSKLIWEILPDTAHIDGLDCQKAVCQFGNRRWFAWFASAIPISDGPYKFCGLPGLIVQIEDDQQFYKFSLLSYTVSKHEVQPFFRYPYLNSTKEKFYVLKNEYRMNGIQMNEATGNIIYMKNKGALIQQFRAMGASDNNWLEFYNDPNRK